MGMEENKKYFIDVIEKLNDEEERLAKRSSAISALRAITFFGGAALLLIGAFDSVFAAGVAGTMALLLFVVLIKIHESVNAEKLIVGCKKLAAERYLQRFDDGWKQFQDNGAALLKDDNVMGKDLDLFGNASLYQLISVCHTEEGKRRLADSINNCHDTKNPEKINAAVQELMADVNGALSFEALGIRNEGRKRRINTEKFREYCFDGSYNTIPLWAGITSIVLPVVEIALIAAGIFGILGFGFAITGFLVLLGYSELTKDITDALVAPLCGMSSSADDYLDMLSHIEKSDYSSDLLRDIKDRAAGEYGAINAYRKLKGVSAAYNISFNPVLYMVMNGLLLWNYRLAAIALGWRKKYAGGAAACMDIIAEMEQLRSLAVPGIVRKTTFARISDNREGEKVSMECRGLYHPLLDPETAVANSADIYGGITIVTGSNMSGKTTFLRTLAVNLVLGMMGAPVCGEYFRSDRMKIFTSMRVTDDVAGGISTFYAEILRIKTMAEYRKNNLPMICLIDEIFKGTNSADRIVGATEVIKGLAGDNCMTIVSTHDFELCEIRDNTGRTATNYHFEEYYEDEKLKFDYLIKDGRCTTTNAKAILKMAGFEV